MTGIACVRTSISFQMSHPNGILSFTYDIVLNLTFRNKDSDFATLATVTSTSK